MFATPAIVASLRRGCSDGVQTPHAKLGLKFNVGIGANDRMQGDVMSKTLVTFAAAASFAVAAFAAPTSAQAGDNGALAAGIIGGLAVGTMIGAGAANNGPYYSPGYSPGPVYYGGSAYPRCYMQRERVWDGFGWRWTRVRVCD